MNHLVQVLTDTNVGGAGRYLLNYLSCYDRSAYRVTVIIPEGSQLCDMIKKHEDVTLIEAPYMADQSYNRHCVKFLKDLFNQIKPDILHTHACLSARIAGRKANVPVILATRHCIEPIARGIKSVAMALFNNQLCDYYIAVSNAVVNNLVESGVRLDKVRLVNNGVEAIKKLPDAAASLVRRCYDIQDDEPLFCMIARLEPIKGHKYFLKAARELVRQGIQAKFLIVGDGSLEMELKDRVKRYGLKNHVFFTGYVADPTEILNAIDVNVNASESEAMCLSILEAMSIGKPSIATNVGGNSELIQDGKEGLLVGYADSTSLAEAMKKLIQNPEYCIQLGQNAKEKFDDAYTVKNMVDRLEEVYKEVLSHD